MGRDRGGRLFKILYPKFFGSKRSQPYFCHPLENERWPVRLSARTAPFHGAETGSIPVRATKKTAEVQRFFCFMPEFGCAA